MLDSDKDFTLRVSPNLLTIELLGVINGDTGGDLITAVKSKVTDTPNVKNVLIDFSNIRDCSLLGRRELINLQLFLKEKKLRTAYLATKPRYKGLGFIVGARSKDSNLNCCQKMDEVNNWFNTDASRLAMKYQRLGSV